MAQAGFRGFETTLTGYITPDLQSTLGYAYTDARIASNLTSGGATIFVGNRVQLVPYNQLSLWNKYQFNPQWAGSVGIIYFSNSFASSDDTVRLPGFVRVDAGVYYKYDAEWSGQVTVQNLFNQGYWASADGNNNISPGALRTVRVSATKKILTPPIVAGEKTGSAHRFPFSFVGRVRVGKSVACRCGAADCWRESITVDRNRFPRRIAKGTARNRQELRR